MVCVFVESYKRTYNYVNCYWNSCSLYLLRHIKNTMARSKNIVKVCTAVAVVISCWISFKLSKGYWGCCQIDAAKLCVTELGNIWYYHKCKGTRCSARTNPLIFCFFYLKALQSLNRNLLLLWKAIIHMLKSENVTRVAIKIISHNSYTRHSWVINI